MLGFWAAAKVMGNHKGNANKLDWTGFLLFAFGLVGLTLGLDLLGESHRDNMTTYSALLVGIALLVTYYFYAKGNERAILPLSLFNTRTFRLGIAANIFIRLSGSAVPFLLPLMFQLSFGYSAAVSGWLLAPIALMSVVFKRFIGHILNILGYKTTLILSSLLMVGSTVSMSWLDTSSSTTWIICNLMWYGACMSMIFTSINTLTVGDLSQAQSGVGSTVLSIVQQVGIGFGIAVASIILTLYRQFMGNDDALQHAFSYTFLTTSVFAIALVWILSYLRKTDGDHLRKKR
jgi:predicted multidrug or homocysteine efflux system